MLLTYFPDEETKAQKRWVNVSLTTKGIQRICGTKDPGYWNLHSSTPVHARTRGLCVHHGRMKAGAQLSLSQQDLWEEPGRESVILNTRFDSFLIASTVKLSPFHKWRNGGIEKLSKQNRYNYFQVFLNVVSLFNTSGSFLCWTVLVCDKLPRSSLIPLCTSKV